MVARMQKMKVDNLVGIGNHNQRKTEKHSNKDIDVERSHLNYDLVEGRTKNYKTDIQAFIDEKKAGTRATRKDAVLVNEWIISSDKMFFEGKDAKEVERFFEETKDYFADKFGDDNIRYAHVHLDENTPHMHLGVVPFDKDHKLSAKRVFNRATLIEIQDELPALMQERGFDIQRGEKGSERKNLTVPEYKVMKDELKEIDKTLEQKSASMKALLETSAKVDVKSLNAVYEKVKVEVETDEKNLFGKPKTKMELQKTGNLIVPEEKFKELLKYANNVATVKNAMKAVLDTDLVNENIEFSKENRALKQENNELKNRNNRLESKVDRLNQQVKSLTKEIGTIYRTVNDTFKRILGDPAKIKEILKGITQEISKNVPRGEFERLNEKENKQVKRASRGRSL